MNEKKMNRRERREEREREESMRKVAQQSEQNRREKTKKIINHAIVVLLLLGLGYGAYLAFKPDTSPGVYDEFAQCLTKAGVTMYGTDWCSHCQNQKRLFGNSFKHVNFINCDTNEAACTTAGVEGYPTWTFSGGRKVSGVQELEELSAMSGCSLAPIGVQE